MKKKSENESAIYNQTKKSSDYHNYFYDYFFQLKRAIHVKLKNAQPNTADDAIEFQSWTLLVYAYYGYDQIIF